MTDTELKKIRKIMQRIYDLREGELEKVKFNYRTRAYAVAGLDLIYNYMQDVLKLIEDKESFEGF